MRASSSRRSARTFVLFLVLAPLIAACSAVTRSDDSTGAPSGGGDSQKPIVIGTSGDFPPMTFRDPKRPADFVGFEVDMTKRIMERMQQRYQVKNIAFQGLVPALQAGQIDAIISFVYNTAERRKTMDFVDYAQSALAIMVPSKDASSVRGYPDLCGKTLGVLTGSAPELDAAKRGSKQCTDAGRPAIKIQSYQSVPDEIQQMGNGRLSAILEDLVSLTHVQSENAGKYRVVYRDPTTVVKAGVVLKQGSPLKAKVEEAVGWYLSSEHYQQDLTKWKLPSTMMIGQ